MHYLCCSFADESFFIQSRDRECCSSRLALASSVLVDHAKLQSIYRTGDGQATAKASHCVFSTNSLASSMSRKRPLSCPFP